MFEKVVTTPNDPKILEGLQKGIYKITGGVVRETASGKIIAHMREVGDVYTHSCLTSLGPILPYLNIGVGVLTLSAVAISTYYISHQISKLSNKLDKLFEEVRKIREDVELLKAIEIFKDLKIGLYFSEEKIKNENLRFELLTDRIKTFRRAVATYDTYIFYALDKLFNGSNPEVVSEPIKLYMLAYAGYSSLLLRLEEIEQAHFESQRAYNRVKEIYKRLVNQTIPSKLDTIKFLKADVEKFWGYKKEIETLEKLNMSYQDWASLTKGKEAGIYLIKLSELNNALSK